MRPSEWIAACKANGIRENTAGNRLSEVRRMQKEFGELVALAVVLALLAITSADAGRSPGNPARGLLATAAPPEPPARQLHLEPVLQRDVRTTCR